MGHPVLLGVEGPDQVVAVVVVDRGPEGDHLDVVLAHQRDGALRADPVDLLPAARLHREQPDLQNAIVVSHDRSPVWSYADGGSPHGSCCNSASCGHAQLCRSVAVLPAGRVPGTSKLAASAPAVTPAA